MSTTPVAVEVFEPDIAGRGLFVLEGVRGYFLLCLENAVGDVAVKSGNGPAHFGAGHGGIGRLYAPGEHRLAAISETDDLIGDKSDVAPHAVRDGAFAVAVLKRQFEALIFHAADVAHRRQGAGHKRYGRSVKHICGGFDVIIRAEVEAAVHQFHVEAEVGLRHRSHFRSGLADTSGTAPLVMTSLGPKV
jgi:hypothetical protein